MSTRAIIGIHNEDGSIKGGWQWNDGMGLIPLLKSQFNTIGKIEKLISNGVWNNIVSPRDKETLDHFMEWTKRDNSDYYLVSVGKCHLLKEKPNDNVEFCFGGDEGIIINVDGSMTFEDFERANGQDINYLYLFYPDTEQWKMFR